MFSHGHLQVMSHVEKHIASAVIIHTCMHVQVELLAKGPQIVVGTPGRVLDLVDDGALTLAAVRYVVLDEADKMLGMGFAPQVMRLQPMLLSAAAAGSQDAKESTKPSGKKAKKLPGTETAAATVGSVAASVTAGGSGRTVKPQVLLLTATMPEEVHAAASAWLHKPLVVQVGHSAASISKTITQVIHVCAEHKKPDKLLKHLAMIKERATGMRQLPSVLVFANRVKVNICWCGLQGCV